MEGKLIVVDGVDSSGKQTQVEKLYESLKKLGHKVMKISFPDYDSDSSALVKMYLNGELGEDPDMLDPYAISTFYAADRYISYITNWKKYIDEGYIVIADRYTTSNMIHQASKIKDVKEKKIFLSWLYDFEFGVYHLPKPDVTIFLNMPVEYGMRLMAERKNKITGEDKKDIHEKNKDYLLESYYNAMYIAKEYGWNIVNCVDNEKVRTIDNISNEILEMVKEIV